jgi:hypothetical protein
MIQMKLRILTYALTAVVLITTACKKNNGDTPGSTSGSQLAAKVDGVDFKSSDVVAIVNNAEGSFLFTAKDSHENSISISGPNRTGTFTAQNDNITGGIYTNSAGAIWMSTMDAGDASITITKYDASAKKMSGTFTFTAPAIGTSGATGTKTVTNGSFTDVKLLIQ